jgi:hypothetical protein
MVKKEQQTASIQERKNPSHKPKTIVLKKEKQIKPPTFDHISVFPLMTDPVYETNAHKRLLKKMRSICNRNKVKK